MKKLDSLVNLSEMVNKGTKYPALKLVEKDPSTAALISKLVKAPEAGKVDIGKKDTIYNLNQSQISEISDSTKGRISDNENILKLFPDIKRCVQILISSVLSPKDMIKTELIYGSNEPVVPSAISAKLNEVIESHMGSYYELEDKLTDILEDALFRTGSYIEAVLPESVVDEIINGDSISTESLTEIISKDNKAVNIGILGPSGNGRTRPALERFASGQTNVTDNYITLEHNNKKISTKDVLEITDNYKLLKLPIALEKLKERSIHNVIRESLSPSIFKGTALESKKLSNYELTSLLYKEPSRNYESFLRINSPTNSVRRSVARPMILRLPSESVIPVYIPGDHTKHIGYFVLTDVDGNPVTREKVNEGAHGLDGLQGQRQNQNTISSMLLERAKANLTDSDKVVQLDQMTDIYMSVVEKDLLDRLRNGIYGSDVEISSDREVYRIMLSRTLASKFTRLIYIPSELMSYFAFDYFENGVGKSYMDDIKLLSSLRAMLMFSKIMAQVKSSINITEVGITLDPEDPDPMKTIEMAQHDISRLRQSYFPLGVNNPVDLTDWLQRAGLQFRFEGHPGLPKTSFEFETKNLQHQIPEQDLEDDLRKQTYLAFGLAPEVIDSSFDPEFATSIVSNNIFHSKITFQLQDIFTRQLTKHIKRIINNDPVIIKELMEVVEENLGVIEKVADEEFRNLITEDKESAIRYIVNEFVKNIRIELPRADLTTLENQKEAFAVYKEALEDSIDFWWSSQIIEEDIAGDISQHADSIKEILKAHFLRDWMARNNYMPELADIVSVTETGEPVLDIYEVNDSHTKSIMRSAVKFIEKVTGHKLAANKDLDNLGTEEPEGGGFDTGEGTSSDDMDMDLDI